MQCAHERRSISLGSEIREDGVGQPVEFAGLKRGRRGKIGVNRGRGLHPNSVWVIEKDETPRPEPLKWDLCSQRPNYGMVFQSSHASPDTREISEPL